MVRSDKRNTLIPQLEGGPIRHATLPKALIERVEGIAAVFAEVDGRPTSEWVEDFKRDLHPEKEIALWEVMAGAYSLFTHGRTLSMEAKKETFGVVLQRSMANSQAVMRNLQLLHLSRKDAKQILRYFSQVADAKGVEV